MPRDNAPIASGSLSFLVDYLAGTNPVYMGRAAPGTATSSASWQIRKFTFDASNNVLSMLWASGSPDFNAVWDNRAALAYS